MNFYNLFWYLIEFSLNKALWQNFASAVSMHFISLLISMRTGAGTKVIMTTSWGSHVTSLHHRDSHVSRKSFSAWQELSTKETLDLWANIFPTNWSSLMLLSSHKKWRPSKKSWVWRAMNKSTVIQLEATTRSGHGE